MSVKHLRHKAYLESLLTRMSMNFNGLVPWEDTRGRPLTPPLADMADWKNEGNENLQGLGNQFP